MQTSIVYINNKSNEEFAAMVIKELNNELVQGKTTDRQSFVARLVGQKDNVLLFQIKNGNVLVNKVSDIVSLRKFNPAEHEYKPRTSLNEVC